MFGSIKKLITNLISGILGFVTGLLPGKKKGKSNGYYLELDEAKEVAKDAVKEIASNAQKVADTVAANANKAAQTVTSNASESLNGTKTAATKAKTANKAKPADVEMVQTAEGLRIEPGKNGKAAAAKAVKEQPKETTFAPKYLSPSAASSNSRRRPGANMSAYLDMARQVKTPG
jgi:gas vesicle protein